MNKRDERIRAQLKSERQLFNEAPIPTTREELEALEVALMKLCMHAEAFETKVEVLPPNPDSSRGMFRVTMLHPKGTQSSTGVHLYDAIWACRNKIYEAQLPQPELVEVSADHVPTPKPEGPKVSAASIQL